MRMAGRHRPCVFRFYDGCVCQFVAGHVGPHITRAEWLELRAATRPAGKEWSNGR